MKKKILITIGALAILLILTLFYFSTFCSDEKRSQCNSDSDCICSEESCFTGSKEYFKHCRFSSFSKFIRWCVDGCMGKQMLACVDNRCTTQYPQKDWDFEDCENKLESEKNVEFCKTGVIVNMVKDGGDIELCNQVPEEKFKRWCNDTYYMRVAKETKNFSICNTTWAITSFDDLACRNNVIIASENVSLCYLWTIEDEWDCYMSIAVKTGDVSICELVKEKMSSQPEKYDQCIYVMAVHTKNGNLCRTLPSDMEKPCLKGTIMWFNPSTLDT